MAEGRNSKKNGPEILASAFVEQRLNDFRAYSTGLTMATTNPVTNTNTTPPDNPLQAVFDGVGSVLPAQLKPYAPAITIGGAAALLLLLMRGK